jgi:hypothetical protein
MTERALLDIVRQVPQHKRVAWTSFLKQEYIIYKRLKLLMKKTGRHCNED